MTPQSQREPVAEPSAPMRLYVHVVVVAMLAAVAVLAWLAVYMAVNRLLWDNDLVEANRWIVPVIVMPFSLLAGLLVKYRKAPTNLDGSMLDSLSGDPRQINWRGLPVNVLMAWTSLWSGAVLGPEGGIGGIASKLAALYGERLRIPVELRSRLVFTALASAYNGLVANPLFTGVLGTELVADPASRTRTLPANLIGGSIGFLVFMVIGSTGLQDYLHLTDSLPITPLDGVAVVAFGLVGMVCAAIMAAMFRVAEGVFGRLRGREVERALLAGLVFSVVGVAAPVLLASGELQVGGIAANPGAYGPAVLVAMALAKLALLAVAFRSGFLGGPTFPAIFASVCVAEAACLLVPGLRVDIVIGGVTAGFLTVVFKAPFMVILLTSVMLDATPEVTALLTLAVAAVMIVMPSVRHAVEGRQARRGSGSQGGETAPNATSQGG